MWNPSEWASEVKKGLFGIFQKISGKISEKTKMAEKRPKNPENVPKLVPDINSYYFYDMNPLKRDFCDFWPFFEFFTVFYQPSLETRFRLARPAEINVFHLILVADIPNFILKP